MTCRRTTAPALALALALLLLVLGGAGQARAVGYRYWSFWDLTGGKWTYATQGPSTARPSDGDVQGFRFAVSEDSQHAVQPRGKRDFAAICAGTPAQQGKKRVALVIDSGTAADAPSGETPPSPRTACARVAPDASTAEALAAVAKPLRYDTNALLCAISGYPRTGCGDPVAATEPTASARPHASEPARHGPSVGLLAGVAAVAVLGAGAVWQARRHRH
ncbi:MULTISPECIES: SCO2322 family protein [unclassified Streptomyces]|uniref:SCO2322 family protein n=1 Tax=unclassified Streptomyces TaxID=2593676 RepID=UPI00224F4246|nr:MULTISPECIES: SCO2322 family protein [unclassified Streptomyces]MCX4991261.1 SCO2322 family protein [Streptomyces sp. NBC_00568]MCX5003502.1 SCO2322 family protein [Streptomyces sp. NBC_00638]